MTNLITELLNRITINQLLNNWLLIHQLPNQINIIHLLITMLPDSNNDYSIINLNNKSVTK